MSVYSLNSTGARVSQIATAFNSTITTTTQNLTLTLNVANLTSGRYEIYGESADDHNPLYGKAKHELVNGIEQDDKNLKLKFDKGDIDVYSPDTLSYKVYDQDNKYRIEYEFTKYNNNIIILKNAQDWKYRNTYHKAHLVNSKLNKYFDLDTDDFTIKSVKEKNGDWEITLDTKELKVKTNSIGDLNFVTSSWYFNVTDGFTFYAKDVITNISISNFTVTIYNSTGTLQEKSTTVGNLTFNITSGIYSFNMSDEDYVTNQTFNYTFTGNSSTTVYLAAANSLYFIVYDEQTNTLITDRNVTIDVINYENVSYTYKTDTGYSFQSGFAAGDYEINYKATNYTARSYYTTVSGGDTQSIELFLLTDTDSTHSYKNLYVIDESATPLFNATVKMQRYYITENAWQTVEMTKTNDQGQGFVFTELYDVSYRFVVDYAGSTVKTTAQSKLDTRDLYIAVSLLTDGIGSYDEVNGVTTSIVYDNSTKMWTYNFDANSVTIDQVRLVIKENDNITESIIHNATSTAQSGALTFNMTGYSYGDGTYYAYGYVTTSSDSRQYLVEVDSISFDELYLNYGLNGLYLSLLIIGTFAFAGLYNPTVAISFALFGLLIVTAAGLMYLAPAMLMSLFITGFIFIISMKT